MKIIELRPDSKLLKANFDGYKLSLEPIPVLRVENISKPHQVSANLSSEFSFLHSSLYQLHNHLVADPWLHNTAYYFDSSSSIQKIQYDSNTGKLKPVQPVFRCAIKTDKSAGVYNVDFKFISEKFAVVSDGIGTLKIIETGDRQKNDEWKSIQTFEPLDGTGFIIQEAKFVIEKGEKLIHCLLLHIEQVDGKFLNFVEWITFKQNEGAKSWEIQARRTIQGKGSLYYLSLDPKCKSIVYSSNHEYKFSLDTVNEIIEEAVVPEIENLQVDETESSFKWMQDGEDITVNFNTIPDVTKDMFKVKCESNRVEVTVNGKTLMNSDLFGEIETDLTTWSLQNDFLQLNLIKKEPELVWSYLIPGGPPMEFKSDNQPELLNTAPVSDLNSQMEDCDYSFDGQQDVEFFIGELNFLIFLSIN